MQAWVGHFSSGFYLFSLLWKDWWIDSFQADKSYFSVSVKNPTYWRGLKAFDLQTMPKCDEAIWFVSRVNQFVLRIFMSNHFQVMPHSGMFQGIGARHNYICNAKHGIISPHWKRIKWRLKGQSVAGLSLCNYRLNPTLTENFPSACFPVAGHTVAFSELFWGVWSKL